MLANARVAQARCVAHDIADGGRNDPELEVFGSLRRAGQGLRQEGTTGRRIIGNPDPDLHASQSFGLRACSSEKLPNHKMDVDIAITVSGAVNIIESYPQLALVCAAREIGCGDNILISI
jgi:hypothetical protein